MKHNLFSKNTALVTGMLLAVSGRAIAFSPNNREFSDVESWHNSKTIIAQEGIDCDETLEPGVGVAVGVSVAVRAFDRSIAVVRTVSITEKFPPEAKEAVIQALQDVSRTLGEALSSAEVDDNVAVATAVSKAISVGTGTAQVVAVADADAAQAITEATACASRAGSVAGAEVEQT